MYVDPVCWEPIYGSHQFAVVVAVHVHSEPVVVFVCQSVHRLVVLGCVGDHAFEGHFLPLSWTFVELEYTAVQYSVWQLIN